MGHLGGTERDGGKLNGVDHGVAARSGMVMPVATTPQGMPALASGGTSQPMAPKCKQFASPRAKYQTLLNSSYKFLLVCNLV